MNSLIEIQSQLTRTELNLIHEDVQLHSTQSEELNRMEENLMHIPRRIYYIISHLPQFKSRTSWCQSHNRKNSGINKVITRQI